MDYREIGRRIKEERIKHRLTQYQLAEMVKISPQYLGKIERGEKQFSFETIVQLSTALKTTLDYLAFGHNGNMDMSERVEAMRLICKLSDRDLHLANELLKVMVFHKNKEIV